MVKLSCCDIMEQQLTNRCVQHGQECPDNVVQITKQGKLGLAAENADYTFSFCPWCGRELPEELKWV